MALLLDNDIIHKLAQLDLLPDATILLTETYNDLKVLHTLRYKFCHPDSKKRIRNDEKYTAVVTKRIEDFLNSNKVEEVSVVVSDSMLIEAMNLDGLDEGEMQLLQSLFDEGEQLLFTGDKRFLKALTKAELLQDKLVEVDGKFISFEQIVSFLIGKLSFEKIKEHYVDALKLEIKLDASLRICFSKREHAVETEVIEALSMYIDDLKKETGNLLGHI